MTKFLALAIILAFLTVGCKNDDRGVTIKEEDKGSSKEKRQSGELLWAKSCGHAIELMKKSDAMKDVPRDRLEEVLQGAEKECVERFKKIGGKEADESADCMLKIDKFDPKKFAECDSCFALLRTG